MNPAIYKILTGFPVMVFAVLLLWIIFKSTSFFIKKIGLGHILDQPKFAIALYVVIAITILLNGIGLLKALSYITAINAINMKLFLIYISKRVLVLSCSAVVLFFLVKRRPEGFWLSALYVAGLLAWFSYYSYGHSPQEVKNSLFAVKNTEMAWHGAIQFRASFFAFLIILLANILFSSSSKSYFSNK